MREYFHAYHSMLEAMRKLSDAECGRLFRGLLYYSMTEEQPDNLQGREELLFDVFSQNIDREIEKYNEKCKTNKRNITSRYQSLPVVTNRNQSKQEKEKEKEKEKDEEKDKEKDKERVKRASRFTPPTVDEVMAYASEKSWTSEQFDPERFVDFYASKGWKVGRDPMKDWKAAARGWVSRGNERQTQSVKSNPALDYAQREYKAEDFGDDFFIDLDKYGEG